MPELPDVERFRRFLAEHAAGRRIDRTVVTDAGILHGVTAPALDRALRGERFLEPGRVGKWLLADTTGPTVLLHFGMTGDLSWAPDAWGRHRHDRVIFETEGGELRYRNMRKLGGVWLAHDEVEARAAMGSLGPDALRLSRDDLARILGARRGRVKAVLMNQSVMAGVGNIVADEALWRARIHPARAAEGLTPSEVALLHDALTFVMETSIDHPGPTDEIEGWLTAARGTPEASCPRCGTLLHRATVAGRTTYSCPECQAID